MIKYFMNEAALNLKSKTLKTNVELKLVAHSNITYKLIITFHYKLMAYLKSKYIN